MLPRRQVFVLSPDRKGTGATPRNQFYLMRPDGGYRQDFLCEFIQPADRLTDMETIQRMFRADIDQWYFEPIFHDHIPAPKPVTAKPVTEPRP